MKWLLILLINGYPLSIDSYDDHSTCSIAGSNAQSEVRKLEPDTLYVCLRVPK